MDDSANRENLKSILKENLQNISINLDNSEEKWKVLYKYSRQSLDEEVNRYQLLDAKAIKLLNTTSVVLTVFLAFLNWFINLSNATFSIYIYLLSSAAFLTISIAWFYYFRSMRPTKVPRMPLNPNTFELFKAEKLCNIYIALHKTCLSSVEDSCEINEKKASYLKLGYYFTALSSALIFILVCMVSYQKTQLKKNFENNTGSTIMSEKKDNPKKEPSEPNFDIVAPKYKLVTNDKNKLAPKESKGQED